MSRLPELPQAIYKIAAAHSSLEPAFDPDYGDSKWMEAIGRMVLPAVIAEVISTKRPLAENIKGEVDKRLESDTLAEWCTQCELRAHVHCVPTFKESLNDPDVSCDILYTFVGAVHAASGVDGVRSWLGRLIDPAYEENNENAFKRAKIEPMTNGFSSQPPPPTSQPPPPPTSAPPPVPSGPSNSSVSLSYLNQVASQRRINVAWNTNMSGPSHNPQWTAECVLNGIVKGTGIAQSKQAAKEQAARSTVHMMGF
ncbi:unnamed protein product [Peniophora sp. CBMAI 1063]|nr:unnamed protein product [Peniophora sp. CBMAI 1063]